MNFDVKVQEQIQKLFTIMLPSNTLGQIALELALNPPKENEPSYPLFNKEKNAILKALKEKAQLMEKMFNQMENIQCNDVEGAMYAFPSIKFSEKAKKVSAGSGMTPEKFYVIRLLEETGVALVPGCGFGQIEGTHHFRITTLPSNIDEVMKKIQLFNSNFHSQYKDE
jgi:alanine transaminase